MLSGCIGKSDEFNEAIAGFSAAYADLNGKYRAAVEKAVRTCHLKAITEEST